MCCERIWFLRQEHASNGSPCSGLLLTVVMLLARLRLQAMGCQLSLCPVHNLQFVSSESTAKKGLSYQLSCLSKPLKCLEHLYGCLLVQMCCLVSSVVVASEMLWARTAALQHMLADPSHVTNTVKILCRRIHYLLIHKLLIYHVYQVLWKSCAGGSFTCWPSCHHMYPVPCRRIHYLLVLHLFQVLYKSLPWCMGDC